MAKVIKHKLLHNIVKQYGSIREFARAIVEDSSDVHRWLSGDRGVSTRAVITICRLHPAVKPYELNPVFPKDLNFKYSKGDN